MLKSNEKIKDVWSVGPVTERQKEKAARILQDMGVDYLRFDQRNTFPARTVLTISGLLEASSPRHVSASIIQDGNSLVILMDVDQLNFQRLDIIRLKWSDQNGLARVTSVRPAARKEDREGEVIVRADFMPRLTH